MLTSSQIRKAQPKVLVTLSDNEVASLYDILTQEMDNAHSQKQKLFAVSLRVKVYIEYNNRSHKNT